LPKARLSKANISALKKYDWPGNVRELENVIERAALIAQGGRLTFDLQIGQTDAPSEPDRVLTQKELRELEIKNFENALRRAKGRISGKVGAAAILGIAPTTAYSKAKALGIKTAQFS
jgi:DNA-binding NtrC family response regulator